MRCVLIGQADDSRQLSICLVCKSNNINNNFMSTQLEQPPKVLDDTNPCNYLDDIRTCCSLYLGFEV